MVSTPQKPKPTAEPAPKFELSRPWGTNAEGLTGPLNEPPQPPKVKVKTTGESKPIESSELHPAEVEVPKESLVYVSTRAYRLL